VRAADAEINGDLVPAGLDLPGRPVLPRDLRAEDGLLAEQYFDGIRRALAAPAEGATGGRGARSGDRPARGSKGGRQGGTGVRSAQNEWGTRREAGSTAEAEPTGCPGPARSRADCPAGRPNCCAGRSRRRSSRTARRRRTRRRGRARSGSNPVKLRW